MKFNWYEDEKSKVVGNLETFIEKLISRNNSLSKQLKDYDKDSSIQKLNDEIKNLRKSSIHIMSKQETKDADEFRSNHWKSCESNIQYILEGTGIGTAISVKCKKCSAVESITDVTDW